MKIRLLISFFTICLFVNISEAQFIKLPKTEEAKEFQERTLIAQLIPANEDSLRRYRKYPEERQAYLNRLAKANEIFKSSVEKYWSMHENISFMSLEEMGLFFENKDATEYAILEADFGIDYRPDPGMRNIIGGFQLRFYLAEKKKSIGLIMTLPIYINDFIYEFLLTNSQKYLNAIADGKHYKDESLWNYEENMSMLENNTLTIPENSLGIEQSEAMEVYNLPLEFVSDEQFISDIRNRKSGILVPLVIFHERKNIWMYAITDPTSMEIASLTPVNSGINFRIVVAKPGQIPDLGLPLELVELISIREAKGFGKKQFKAIPLELGFKLNY